MKNFIWAIAIIILIGQIVGMIFYYLPAKQTMPQGYQAIPNREEAPAEQPLYAEEKVDYSLQNEEVSVTFNKGKTWEEVPINKEELFNGEYNGSKDNLIEGSYVLSKEHAAFLYYDESREEANPVKLLFSFDQGKSWEESVVTEHYPPIRFRKVAFLNDRFGYILISGDRTMSQETSAIFLTHDRGETWSKIKSLEITSLIADGGFVNEKTGFLSYGVINPELPELYVTQDSGTTWNEAKIRIPEKYHKIFVAAEMPFVEENQLAVLVNQGSSGDYKGGKLKGKFLSNDQGETWEFSAEVESDE